MPDIKKIFIATPAAGDQVLCIYVVSLLKTLSAIRKEFGIPIAHQMISGAWTASARNELMYLGEKSEADLIFQIDADMGWEPHDFRSVMLHAWEAGIAGSFYPKKVLNWDALEGVDGGAGAAEGRERVSRGTWKHNIKDDTRVTLEDGTTRVQTDMLPTGFKCMRRDTLLSLKAKIAESSEASPSPFEYWSWDWDREKVEPRFEYYSYPIIKGTLLGEDVLFSRTCNALGIPLWKVEGLELRHQGQVLF
jgi:hypothetical protein